MTQRLVIPDIATVWYRELQSDPISLFDGLNVGTQNSDLVPHINEEKQVVIGH